MYKIFFKRFFDILLSAAALLALWWIMAIVAVLIRLESRGPAIFRQQRLGRGGREFTFYKFRSMSVGAERTGSGVYSGKNDSRVTRIGKILRATSIDELPQLWNILKGDMSLIGPRPPLTYHPWPIDQYTEFQRRMFEVRPGITGWAQVHGRKDVEWNHRIELSVWYVDHLSLVTDLSVVYHTILTVISRKDVAHEGEATMAPFTGND